VGESLRGSLIKGPTSQAGPVRPLGKLGSLLGPQIFGGRQFCKKMLFRKKKKTQKTDEIKRVNDFILFAGISL